MPQCVLICAGDTRAIHGQKILQARRRRAGSSPAEHDSSPRDSAVCLAGLPGYRFLCVNTSLILFAKKQPSTGSPGRAIASGVVKSRFVKQV
jgi:hypothetical protein